MKQENSKHNRKKFFIYSAASLAGVYAFLKSPFRIFTLEKTIKQIKMPSSINVKINSLAVKRDNKVKNG